MPCKHQFVEGKGFCLVPSPLPIQKPMNDPRHVPIAPGPRVSLTVFVGWLARQQCSEHLGLVFDQQPRDQLGSLRASDDELSPATCTASPASLARRSRVSPSTTSPPLRRVPKA